MGLMSNYPNGFARGVLVRNVPAKDPAPGKVFWVGNNATTLVGEKVKSDSARGTFLEPLATIDAAVGLCAASRGDVIYVRPGHVETIATAGALALDVAGITVIGLGSGQLMPRLDFTAGSGTVTVGADDIRLENLNVHANVTTVTDGIIVSDGVDDFQMVGCFFDTETEGTDEFTDCLVFTNDNNRCLVEDCIFDMGIAAAVAAIHIDADTDNLIIRNCYFKGDYSTACIVGDTTLSTNLLIENCLLYNGEGGDVGTEPAIELLTGTTGVIRNNHIVCNVATPDLSIVADACYLFNNFYSETVAAGESPLYSISQPDSAGNFIGVDDANNVASTSNVVANRDGSLLERSEFVMEQMTRGFAVASVDLSAASPRTLFTITGGPILIHFLGIKITAACSANAALLNFNSVPTVGSPTVISKVACAPDLQSAAAGDWFAIAGGSAEVAVKYATGTTLPDIQTGVSGGIVVDAGTITAVMSTDNLTTGTATAYIAFTPLSAGVTVA